MRVAAVTAVHADIRAGDQHLRPFIFTQYVEASLGEPFGTQSRRGAGKTARLPDARLAQHPDDILGKPPTMRQEIVPLKNNTPQSEEVPVVPIIVPVQSAHSPVIRIANQRTKPIGSEVMQHKDQHGLELFQQ